MATCCVHSICSNLIIYKMTRVRLLHKYQGLLKLQNKLSVKINLQKYLHIFGW